MSNPRPRPRNAAPNTAFSAISDDGMIIRITMHHDVLDDELMSRGPRFKVPVVWDQNGWNDRQGMMVSCRCDMDVVSDPGCVTFSPRKGGERLGRFLDGLPQE